MLLAHATGFHGRCWARLAHALTGRFDTWAFDVRGHGASGGSPDGRYDDWSVLVEDLLAVLDTLGGKEWRGFGHSLGGALLLLSEARRPGTLAGICCFEPVVIPPGLLDGDGDGAGQRGASLAEVAMKRRASFPSKRAAWENYRHKLPFSRFDPESLAAYVEFGFLEVPEGRVTLACRPQDESSVYQGAPTSGAWERLGSVGCPVSVLGGEEPANPVARLLEQVVERLPRGSATRVPGVGHFGPFEAPERVAELVSAALGDPIHHERPIP